MPLFDATFTKDPDEVTDYTRNWSRWLSTGDTISASTWIGDGVTVDSSTFDDQSATVIVSGGTAGQEAFLTNRITTTSGKTQDRTIRLLIRER